MTSDQSLRTFTGLQASIIFGITLICFGIFTGCRETPKITDVAPIETGSNPCERFKCKGTFLTGVTWRDSRGENFLLFTEEDEEKEDGTLQRLTAHRYVIEKGNPHEVWQMRHEADNWCDKGTGIIGEPIVTDLNVDGVAEVSYVYNVQGNCDVSPTSYGLIMHEGTDMLEMSGSDRRPENRSVPGNGAINYSDNFRSYPDTFRTTATELWMERVPQK